MNKFTDIHYLTDSFGWSISTLLMCLVGQAVHWLLSYGRARQVSRTLKTPEPGVWLYWYADWPTTVASFLIVFSGYFMLPEMAAAWPSFGKAFALIGEDGRVGGLSMFTSFLWGMCGNIFADYAGRRLSRMVE